jgi:hypothetical protein
MQTGIRPPGEPERRLIAMTKTIQEEVDQNYEAFRRVLPTIIGAHRDKYALMKDGKY